MFDNLFNLLGPVSASVCLFVAFLTLMMPVIVRNERCVSRRLYIGR